MNLNTIGNTLRFIAATAMAIETAHATLSPLLPAARRAYAHMPALAQANAKRVPALARRIAQKAKAASPAILRARMPATPVSIVNEPAKPTAKAPRPRKAKKAKAERQASFLATVVCTTGEGDKARTHTKFITIPADSDYAVQLQAARHAAAWTETHEGHNGHVVSLVPKKPIKHKVKLERADVVIGEDQATTYARWLAQRDGINLPDTHEPRIELASVTVAGKAEKRPRVVHFGAGEALVSIPLPHWDFVPRAFAH